MLRELGRTSENVLFLREEVASRRGKEWSALSICGRVTLENVTLDLARRSLVTLMIIVSMELKKLRLKYRWLMSEWRVKKLKQA